MKSLSLARVLPVLETFESQRREASPTEALRLDLLRQDLARPELRVIEAEAAGVAAELSESSAEADQRQWQEGYEAGVSIGRAQAQAEMLNQDALLRDALAAARAEWVAQEGDRISTGVEKALAFMESEICAVASRILAQIANESIRVRAIAEFSSYVRSLMRDGAAGVITVHAPQDLIAQLTKRLEATLGSLDSLEFRPHESAEVWVRSGASMIEMRLEAWRTDHFSGV
jgi:hypothetical protein